MLLLEQMIAFQIPFYYKKNSSKSIWRCIQAKNSFTIDFDQAYAYISFSSSFIRLSWDIQFFFFILLIYQTIIRAPYDILLPSLSLFLLFLLWERKRLMLFIFFLGLLLLLLYMPMSILLFLLLLSFGICLLLPLYIYVVSCKTEETFFFAYTSSSSLLKAFRSICYKQWETETEI